MASDKHFSLEEVQDKRNAVIGAATIWRKKWIDFEDELEVERGCMCEVCELIRAVDSYLWSVKKPLG